MTGTRRLSPPPTVRVAMTLSVSWTEETRRSPRPETFDTPPRLTDSLTTEISDVHRHTAVDDLHKPSS